VHVKIPLAAVGFTSIVAQVLLMRELVATLYGNELLFGLILMAWLAWVAAGAGGLARLLGGRRRWGARAFGIGLFLASLLLPVQMVVARDLRALLSVTPGAFIELGPMLAAVILILAPVCLLTGLLFALGARLMVEAGAPGGQAYLWESVGAVFGGGLFSFVLVHWLDPFQIALLVTAANLALAVWLLRGRSKLLLFFAVLAAAALPLGHALHRATLGWQWPDLAWSADSPYGRLVVEARDGQRVFYENGLLAFETQGTAAEQVAHFPLLAHPDPRRVLLIGGGVAGDLREILKHPVTRVTYVELDPLLIQAARAYLPAADAAALDDPRAELVLTDGRLYVKQRARAGQAGEPSSSQPQAALREDLDVVILDLPEPATGALNRFYTHEFFSEIRAILNPGGLLALGLPSAENYWSPELARRNASVYHTLRSVFPQVLVLPGEQNFFLASSAPLEADPRVLAARLQARGVETRWVTPDYVNYMFTTDRFAQVQRQLDTLAGVRLNTDLAPISTYYGLMLWLSRFYPGLGVSYPPSGLDRPVISPLALAGVAGLLALVLALARWRGRGVPLAIGAIGLAGMTLEVAILLAFQFLHGYLYGEVSVMMTAFMAGLALGAAGGNWLSARSAARPGSGTKRALLGAGLALAVYSAAFAFVVQSPIPAPVLTFPVLTLLAGALAGMAYPLALVLIAARGASPGRAAAMLYAADLVGGCLGALLGAVFLIPVLGIPQTCWAIAMVTLAGLLALA
jgi:spermidine synthase